MKPAKFYFSTPQVNPDCPFGLKNPTVLVTEKPEWDRIKHIEPNHDLDTWMRKKGFGELTPNFYQADNPELMTSEAVKNFLETKGMTHNPALDSDLVESFELWT